MYKGSFILVTAILLTAGLLNSAQDEGTSDRTTKRIGLFIGANNGGPGRTMLRYAASDAKDAARVFTTMGGITPADVKVLIEPRLGEVEKALADLEASLDSDRKKFKRTEIVFYYSGHSDEDGLLLNREILPYRRLRSIINGLAADMRIVILDSCSSGAFTRSKGGTRTAPFLADASINASGHAFLTSSSADEVSQESDALESSYFTHNLLSGLRGAADASGDGKVTLSEAYQYAYDTTLSRTERSENGPQHPNYDMNISGSGDIVMTDLKETTANLLVAANIAGRISIRDSSGYLLAEIMKLDGRTVGIGVEPGAYTVVVQKNRRFFEGIFRVGPDSSVTVTADKLSLVSAEAATARGEPAFQEEVDKARAETNGPGSPTGSVETMDERPVASIKPATRPRTPDGDYTIRPFHLAVLPDRWIFSKGNRFMDIIAVSLLGSDCDRLRGLAWSPVMHIIYGDGLGVEWSGVFNIASADFRGVQWAGVFNIDGGDLSLVRWAGVFNIGAGATAGIDWAGVFNIAGKDVYGLQWAGVLNIAGKSVNGLQWAGVFNITGKDVSGLQWAGVLNIAGGDVFGSQMAGVINICGGSVKGAQLGLVNVAADSTFSLGLINIIRGGILHPSVWVDQFRFVNLGFRSGNRFFYTSLNAGVNPAENTVISRAGIGFEIPIRKFFVDIDALGGYIRRVPGLSAGLRGVSSADWKAAKRNDGTATADLRLSLGFKPVEHFGAFAGVSATYVYRIDRKGPLPRAFGDRPVSYLDDNRNYILPGIFFGIQF